MSDTPSWHPTLPITREADQSWDWVSALWVVGTLPKAFVLFVDHNTVAPRHRESACVEGIERLQEIEKDEGISLVQMEGVFSLQWDPSFPFCQWVPAIYMSGLHPGEAVKFGTGAPVTEPLYPERQRDQAVCFVLGIVLRTLQAHCRCFVP